MSDWRLRGQERYLKGVALSKKRYHACGEGWDHDHCAFCFAKFSEQADDINEGYATLDNYYWVCETCYQDFKAIFQWAAD